MKKMLPKISVIIPTYNSEYSLGKAIKSVLNQTFKNFELIIIDNGSTDNTKKIVKQFKKNDIRIKYFWQHNSGGAANPKNNAIPLCSGQYIAYLDHDDEWMSKKLAQQLALIESEPNIGIVTCYSLIKINKNKEIIHKIKPLQNFEDFLNNPSDYIFSNSSVIMPKKVIEDVGKRDETLKILEDFDYFIRTIQKGYKIKFINAPLLKYYYHNDNLSKDKRRILDYELFLKKHKKLFLKQGNYTRANYFRHFGTVQLLNGEKKESIKYFFQAIKTKPNLKNITTFFISLILSKKLYEKILNLKIRLAIK
jgi:glycosyltransferase involved in cell wall biosynthesis